jgi:phosphoribosyl-ATP pyrophosphohydrolase
MTNKESIKQIYDQMLEDVYKEVRDLDKQDECPISNAVCKFSEESGEWIREINKTTGRKTNRETTEEIRANIVEEAADTFQNLLLLCGRFDMTMEELLTEVKRKNKKWAAQIPERQNKVTVTLDNIGKSVISYDDKVIGRQG